MVFSVITQYITQTFSSSATGTYTSHHCFTKS